MIKLRNGSTVLRADLTTEISASDETWLTGFVLALTPHDEYVTWYVSKLDSAQEWDAAHGHYFGSDEVTARADYHDRRQRSADVIEAFARKTRAARTRKQETTS